MSDSLDDAIGEEAEESCFMDDELDDISTGDLSAEGCAIWGIDQGSCYMGDEDCVPTIFDDLGRIVFPSYRTERP